MASLGGVAATIALAACGAVPVAPPAEAPKAAAPAPKEAPKTAEQVKVVIGNVDAGPVRNKVLAEEMPAAVNEVLKDKGVWLTYIITPPGTDLWGRMQAEFAARQTSMDIGQNQVNWVGPGAIRGIFEPLDQYLAKDRIVAQDEYLEVKQWMVKNKLYALPFFAAGELLLFNKQLFGQAGLELPNANWTWNDLLTAATKLTKREGEKTTQWGFNLGYVGFQVNLSTYILNNGGKVLNDTRDKALWGDDPKAIEGAQVYFDYVLKHRVTPWGADRQAVSQEGGGWIMASGRVAMEQYVAFAVAQVTAKLKDDLGAITIPKGPAAHTAALGTNAWSLMALSKVKDAAWEALKVWNGEVGQKLYAKIGYPALVKAGPEYHKQFPTIKWDPLVEHWRKAGRDYMVTVDMDEWQKAAHEQIAPVYEGKRTVPEGMKMSADAANAVFAKRPPEMR